MDESHHPGTERLPAGSASEAFLWTEHGAHVLGMLQGGRA
jgi:hypothetical protein